MTQLQKGLNHKVAPVIVEDGFRPNIDSSYTSRQYEGDRIAINMTPHTFGIKSWGSGMATQMQGMAIYGDILVRTRNATTGHKIYQIGANGNLTELASFDLNIGHANALQFAPVLESGQVFPYLYAVGLSGKCYVMSIAADYTVTLVQTITINGVLQVLQGDDGYLWTHNDENADNSFQFAKYRKVKVSEGDVTLTDADRLDWWDTNETFPPATVTSQGYKVKFGKIWYSYGWPGSDQNRGILVYDTATHRLLTNIDLTSFTTEEFEDVEFYDNALILATYGVNMYIMRF